MKMRKFAREEELRQQYLKKSSAKIRDTKPKKTAAKKPKKEDL